MSYTIVYDQVFIKTNTGISAIILVGDSDVWETQRKRERHWSCIALNKTEDEMKQLFIGEGEVLFKISDKWIDLRTQTESVYPLIFFKHNKPLNVK